MKHILFYLFIAFSFCAMSQNNDNFESAEERIVYNKQKGLDKYEGINISYTYEVNLKSEVPAETFEKIGNHFFQNVLDVQIFEADNKKYVSYLTEASQSNNTISRELPKTLNNEFIFSKRTYHLK